MKVKKKMSLRSLFGRGETEYEVEADTLEDIKKLLELIAQSELKLS